MSLYADYLMEKTEDKIVETDYGFATYRFLDNGKTVYIVDIYIVPSLRASKKASMMADDIVAVAKLSGCTKLLGSVIPSNKNSTTSLQVLIGYGMTLQSSSNDFILFQKGI